MSEITDQIAALEGATLDAVAPASFEILAPLEQLEFVRVTRYARFWETSPGIDPAQYAADMLTGAHAIGGWCVFLLKGTPDRLEVYFSLDRPGTAMRVLQSAFPGIHVESSPPTALNLRSHLGFAGMLTAVPGLTPRKSARDPNGPVDVAGPLARVMRGMRGSTWSYVVAAYPCETNDIPLERQGLLDRLATTMSATRRTLQRTVQASTQRTDRESQSVSDVTGADLTDPNAQYLADLLQLEVDRLNSGLASGRWQVAVHFGASDETAARRLGALLASSMAGPEPYPNRLRVVAARPGARRVAQEDFHPMLTSVELSKLVALPGEEAPGYALSDFAPFDVDFHASPGPSVQVGQILHDEADSGTAFRVPLDDLAKHGLVAGVTGAGKTTTIRALLLGIRRAGLPFLVVEPAKTEYRVLLGGVVDGRSSGPLPDLQVFTLGNEHGAPFRMNPFEFETDELTSSPMLLSHIDFLKATFNSAFVLYAPMPYVLETALHEIYEDKGWDLASGENLRLPGQHWSARHGLPIFPTLGDLYRKIVPVTRRLGYEERIEQDVIAVLRARVGSLRIGSKGLMLDVPRGNQMADLLTRSTVLELENIGNDAEKTFLMGLILSRVFEYRRLQAARGTLPRGLQHLIVIEEAHRLLPNVSTEVETESSNLRAQAVGTFVNLLSEVRRYGQGVVVAEQIPSKLAPDAIKNTSLKIVHRLLAEDDRAALGATMNMTERQQRQLISLPPGRAAAFAEGADHPYLIAVEDVLDNLPTKDVADRDVATAATKYVKLGDSLLVRDFAHFGIPATRLGAPDVALYQRALNLVTTEIEEATWARLIVRVIYARGAVTHELTALRRRVATATPQFTAAQSGTILRLVLALGAGLAVFDRAADRGWPYLSADGLRESLVQGLLHSLRDPASSESAAYLDRFVRGYESHNEQRYGPYPGCPDCPAVCQFRSDVARMLQPATRNLVVRKAGEATPATALARYTEIASAMRALVSQWTSRPASTGTDTMAYCAALTAAAEGRSDSVQQTELARNISTHLL